MFTFDIFGFISGLFILIFVITIIVFIIIIVVVYKLLHNNVEHENSTTFKLPKSRTEVAGTAFVKTDKEDLTKEKLISKCKYCSEKIESNIAYCPFCGSHLSE